MDAKIPGEAAKYVAIKAEEPFGVGISRTGDDAILPLACVGAGHGMNAPEGKELWAEDGTLQITAAEYKAGLLGIVFLVGNDDEAPMELCLSLAGVQGLKKLCERIEVAMVAHVAAAEKSVLTAQQIHKPRFGDGPAIH